MLRPDPKSPRKQIREVLISAAIRGLSSGIVRFLLDRFHELL